MSIIVNFVSSYRKVIKKENIFISGSLFIGDVLFSEEHLLDDLKWIRNTEQLESKLSLYNGFFTFVINQGNELFAAVDRIRSIPLFYGKINNDFYISNDATWVFENVSDNHALSHMAQQELLLTGYVTGQDTLYENVKQLQAGEYVYLKNDNGSMEIITKRYYRFLHKEPDVLPEVKVLQKNLDEVMNSIIKRLIIYANGRQIVIPLSAGHDSRLIALKLKQLGYKKVLCFSYGVTGNFEAETSKKIANLLGFPWEYVAYTEKLWKEWFNTTERRDYFDIACNGVSLPHIQDWLAVWELKKCGTIEFDAVFTPGHTGFFAGSTIPPDAYPHTKSSIMNLVCAILRRHYSLVVWSKNLNKTRKYWEDRIIKNCEIQKITDGYGYADASEKWEWQERQAKFIVNSIRVYEFFGFDWWLPLCDNSFMLYWQDVPLQYRKNKIFYKGYVDNLYEAITGDKGSIETYKEKRKYIKFLLKKVHLYYFAAEINDYIKRKIKKTDTPHIHAWHGAFSEEFKEKYLDKTNNINGLLTIFILNEMGRDADSILE